jgi:hypothetical protein
LPLYNRNGPFETVPQAFIICLAPGYSLLQHSEAIQTNIQPYDRHIFNFNDDEVIYRGGGIDDHLLSAFRSDPGVTHLSCDCKPGLDADSQYGDIDGVAAEGEK